MTSIESILNHLISSLTFVAHVGAQQVVVTLENQDDMTKTALVDFL